MTTVIKSSSSSNMLSWVLDILIRIYDSFINTVIDFFADVVVNFRGLAIMSMATIGGAVVIMHYWIRVPVLWALVSSAIAVSLLSC